MEEVLYDSLARYFNTLEAVGYVSYNKVKRLILLKFVYDFVYQDYRGKIKQEDYKAIDRMLDCLFGTCLIPYRDYAMGNLELGSIGELQKRLDEVEEKVDKIEVGGIPGSDDKTILERIAALENEPVVLWEADLDH